MFIIFHKQNRFIRYSLRFPNTHYVHVFSARHILQSREIARHDSQDPPGQEMFDWYVPTIFEPERVVKSWKRTLISNEIKQLPSWSYNHLMSISLSKWCSEYQKSRRCPDSAATSEPSSTRLPSQHSITLHWSELIHSQRSHHTSFFVLSAGNRRWSICLYGKRLNLGI